MEPGSAAQRAEVEFALPRLAAGAEALRRRDHAGLVRMLADCRRSIESAAPAWVETSAQAKGWLGIATARAEEWASGPLPVARTLFALHELHRGLANGRLPSLHRCGSDPADGAASWSALPLPGLADPLLLAGYRARIDVAADARQIAPPRLGGVALVLGAGNVTATPMLDVLHQVFLRGRAVVLKLSPLHASLATAFAKALQPLLAADVLSLCQGTAELGAALARDPAITAVHLTGSTSTWQQLRADPALAAKALTAEVGCCTPALVVPGPWLPHELRHTARQLAAFAALNGGATCLAPRLVLTARQWPQRERFLQMLRDALAGLPARRPFHPAAAADFARATGKTPTTETLPPTLCAGLDPHTDAERFAREHFAPVLLETASPATDTATWLQGAARFVREHVAGALSAYLFAPRSVLEQHRRTIDATVAQLPHGTIAINTWTGLGYGLGTTPWGAPPDARIEHGAGWTHDTLCLDRVKRTVIEAPFRPRPLPPWLPSHRCGEATLRALCRYYLAPSALRLTRTVALALCSP